MKLILKAGTTSKVARVFIQDSSQSDGRGLTGLAYNTSNLKWNYAREDQAAAQVITPVTATLGTWTSAGFKEVDATNMPGIYEIGIPNAALASSGSVQMLLFGATNMAVCPIEIELTAADIGADTSGTTTLLSRLSSTRAGYLDNLTNLDAAISSLNNLSALANLYGSPVLEIPDSGTTQFAYTLVVRDNEGKLRDLDGSPTLTAANAAGTDRSANLSAVSHPGTGRYTFTYGVSSAAAEESLRITVSGTVSSEARYIEWIGAVVNYDTLTTLNAINTKLGTPAGASVSADIAAVTTAVGGSALRTALGLGSANLDTQFSGIPAAVRDVNNTTPASNSLGAAVNSAAAGGLDPQEVADLVVANLGTVDANVVTITSQATGDVADKILGRNLAGGADGGRTVKQALRFLRNKWSINGSTLIVCLEDDQTADWTATLTMSSTANPITGSDPA